MLKIETYNTCINEFLKDLELSLSFYGIKFILSTEPYVLLSAENKCNGYFDDIDKVLTVGINKPLDKWFPILVHESCHFDQWRENCDVWKNYYAASCSDNILDKILSGTVVLSEEENNKYFSLSRDLELDCERRTIAKIKKYCLPIDIKAYAKSAAAYVLFYNFVAKYKKWYIIGKEPYNTKEILDIMPNNLDGDFSELEPALVPLFYSCVTEEQRYHKPLESTLNKLIEKIRNS
jgi:hypothetical protein